MFFQFPFFFLISLWFEFRNKDGTVPISLKELEFIHNYALKALAEQKFDDPFWSSTSVLCAIKPKFEAYLEGIDYLLKLLKETPRERANDGNINVFVLFLCCDSCQGFHLQTLKAACNGCSTLQS